MEARGRRPVRWAQTKKEDGIGFRHHIPAPAEAFIPARGEEGILAPAGASIPVQAKGYTRGRLVSGGILFPKGPSLAAMTSCSDIGEAWPIPLK